MFDLSSLDDEALLALGHQRGLEGPLEQEYLSSTKEYWGDRVIIRLLVDRLSELLDKEGAV